MDFEHIRPTTSILAPLLIDYIWLFTKFSLLISPGQHKRKSKQAFKHLNQILPNTHALMRQNLLTTQQHLIIQNADKTYSCSYHSVPRTRASMLCFSSALCIWATEVPPFFIFPPKLAVQQTLLLLKHSFWKEQLSCFQKTTVS